jgi:hypothetical protein
MKQLLLLMFVFSFKTMLGQPSITGIWHSQDSSRVYKVQNTKAGIEASILQSTRKQDVNGVTILNNCSFSKKDNCYSATIHSTNGGHPRFAKIYLINNGTELKIKIPRLLFFPVKIYWKKAV